MNHPNFLKPFSESEYYSEYVSVAIYDEQQQSFLVCSDSTKNKDLANIWLTEILASEIEYKNSAQIMETEEIPFNYLINGPDTLHW